MAEELFRTCSNNDELPELVASIIGAPSLAMGKLIVEEITRLHIVNC